MEKRTKIIIGVLFLFLVFGVVYSFTTPDTKADCKRHWVNCYYCLDDKTCPPSSNFKANTYWRCYLCEGDWTCPPDRSHCYFVTRIACGCGNWPPEQ